MHDKEQELNLVVDRYEKKLRSLQAEIEEKDTSLEKTKETIA